MCYGLSIENYDSEGMTVQLLFINIELGLNAILVSNKLDWVCLFPFNLRITSFILRYEILDNLVTCILNDKTNSPTTVLNTGETDDIYYQAKLVEFNQTLSFNNISKVHKNLYKNRILR